MATSLQPAAARQDHQPAQVVHRDIKPSNVIIACDVDACGGSASFEVTSAAGGSCMCTDCAARAQALAVILGFELDVRPLDIAKPSSDTPPTLELVPER